jgi:DNA polymerase-1
MSTITKPIVVIDGLNFFLRHYMALESMSSTGEPIGGVMGFIKGVGNLISLLHPDQVVVVWEQGGASPRRKHIFSEYKANRATNKALQTIYRADGRLTPNADGKNKVFQLQLLAKALGNMPICQIYVPDTECDDIIAYIVKRRLQTIPQTKIVVSNDKDFYQLLEDPSIRIYDPARKILIDGAWVLDKFGISPRNMTLARALVGDPSDNLNGVPGVGFKTVAGRFPDVARTDMDLDLTWIREAAAGAISASKKPPKCYGDILREMAIVERNWKLMFLDTSCLAPSQIEKVDYKLENFKSVCNRLEFIKTFTTADIPVTQDLDSAFSASKTLVRQI